MIVLAPDQVISFQALRPLAVAPPLLVTIVGRELRLSSSPEPEVISLPNG